MLLPRMLKQGCLKSAGLIVTGQPKKRKVSCPLPFAKESPNEKEKGMGNLKLVIF